MAKSDPNCLKNYQSSKSFKESVERSHTCYQTNHRYKRPKTGWNGRSVLLEKKLQPLKGSGEIPLRAF